MEIAVTTTASTLFCQKSESCILIFSLKHMDHGENEVNIRNLTGVIVALSLGACATVPQPPHCEGNGEDLQPINPEMMTQGQINAVRETARQHEMQRIVDTRGDSK